MGIDARIPLGVTPPDPNGFTNALAAGMKMRELQNAGDRAAYKDEAAVRKSNALSKFGQSDRGPEAVRTLYAEAPDAAPGVEKNIREAEAHDAATKKAQLEWGMANYKLLRDASASVVANPTRENATAVLDELEAQHGDMTRVRSQMEQTPDHAIGTLFKGLGSTVPQLEQMRSRERRRPRSPVGTALTRPTSPRRPRAACRPGRNPCRPARRPGRLPVRLRRPARPAGATG